MGRSWRQSLGVERWPAVPRSPRRGNQAAKPLGLGWPAGVAARPAAGSRHAKRGAHPSGGDVREAHGVVLNAARAGEAADLHAFALHVRRRLLKKRRDHLGYARPLRTAGAWSIAGERRPRARGGRAHGRRGGRAGAGGGAARVSQARHLPRAHRWPGGEARREGARLSAQRGARHGCAKACAHDEAQRSGKAAHGPRWLHPSPREALATPQ